MKTPRCFMALTLAAGLLPCWRANAQFTGSLGGNFNNPGSALLQTMIANRMLADAAKKRVVVKPSNTKGADAKTESSKPCTFKPVAKSLMVKRLAESFCKEETARGEFVTLFEGYLKAFDEQAKTDKEPSYDVGRAAAFFVLSNYAVATGSELNDPQADGAQAQFRAGLAGNTGFAKMDDRGRQQLYEALVILGSLPATGLADAAEKNDAKQAETFRDFARLNLKTLLGVEVEKIRLTKSGILLDD
jgi:hypothetical protein